MSLIKEITNWKWLIDLLLVLGFIYFIAVPQTLGSDCNFADANCGEDSYCSLDGTCEKFPFKEIVSESHKFKTKHTLFIPMVISVALISLSVWYRKNDKKL